MSLEGKLLARARDRLGEIREKNAAESTRRHSAAYTRVPELRRTDDAIRSIMLELVGCAMGRGSRPVSELEAESLALQEKRAALLAENGWPEDWLDEIYSCPLCRDTGHLADGSICSCLMTLYKKEQTAALSSALRLSAETFDSFRLDYYPDNSVGSAESPRRHMERILKICRAYADDFGPDSTNLLFYGGPGLGKTFLSTAIARVVAEKGFSVVYDSVTPLLNIFEIQKFARDTGEAPDADSRVRQILGCDLLIIDDLGTEMTTSFAVSALYTIINSRLLSGHKTIISTNLTPEQFLPRYNAQIDSRLKGEYLSLDFTGLDIRTLKKEIL